MQAAKYWFQAKSHGYGWSWPLTWQGWLTYAVAAVLLLLGFVLVPPWSNAVAFAVVNGIVVLALVMVCWLKGQPATSRRRT